MKRITILALFAMCIGSAAAINVTSNNEAEENVLKRRNDANIVGHVIDRKTGEHLPYVTIVIKGTTIATLTDATGHYFFKDLPEGRHSLEVKFVGYRTATREILVKEGKTEEVNFELEFDMNHDNSTNKTCSSSP